MVGSVRRNDGMLQQSASDPGAASFGRREQSCHRALDAATQWITDGTATTIAQAKRNDALARQQIVGKRLAGCTVHADPHAYHCRWVLPDPWRADTFVAAAARYDIAVTPAAFTIGRVGATPPGRRRRPGQRQPRRR